MTNFFDLTPAQLRQAADLKEHLDAIFGNGVKSTVTVKVKAVKTKRDHWSQTPEGRAKLAAIQRRRWRKAKK